jgi:hypothetical protein
MLGQTDHLRQHQRRTGDVLHARILRRERQLCPHRALHRDRQLAIPADHLLSIIIGQEIKEPAGHGERRTADSAHHQRERTLG